MTPPALSMIGGGATALGSGRRPQAARRSHVRASLRSDVWASARSGACSRLEVERRRYVPVFTHVTPRVRDVASTPFRLASGPRLIKPQHQHQQLIPNAEAGASANTTQFSGEVSRTGAFLSALYKFTRPHTMLGTFTSVVSISLMALQGMPFGAAAANALVMALVSALLMNVFIVGLNQVYDVDIDKINKPYLPLASGEFSMKTGLIIIGLSLVLSLGVGIMSGSPPLMATLVVSMLLGIAYSADVPLFRWKKNAFAAALCVMAVRAVVVQLGFFFHLQRSIGINSTVAPKPIMIAMSLMFFFAAVIALFKDIPDVRGDTQSGVKTFSVRLGEEKVFWTCIWLLTIMFAGAVGVGLTSEVLWSRIAFPCSQALLAGILWRKVQEMSSARRKDYMHFYMFIWKLFYSEYFCIPLLQ